jgi:phage terminase large subunit-like protein
MEWQRQVVDVALELLPNGRPAYRKVILTVPRQNGKTTMILAVTCHRAVKWGRAQHIGYTAQDGNAARKKLIQEQVPVITQSRLWVLGRRAYQGVGDERIVWKNGSQVDVVASSKSSGHGRTYDLVFFDEAFEDADDRREQSLIPTMITVPDAQVWVVSTAGDEGSVYLRQQTELGRGAAAEGMTTGVAYFEWSAPDDAPIDDPKTWWSCMPALGRTIQESEVAFTRETSSENLFKRTMLNQWTASEDRVIPVALWDAVNVDELEVDRESPIFGLDVAPDRDTASIAVADGDKHCQIVETGLAPSAAAKRVTELGEKYSGSVVIDSRGPAALFRDQIEDAGVKVYEYAVSDIAKACAWLYDEVADAGTNNPPIRIEHCDALDLAVGSATKRVVFDTWTWSRAGRADISPLVALTMAAYKASKAAQVWVYSG